MDGTSLRVVFALGFGLTACSPRVGDEVSSMEDSGEFLGSSTVADSMGMDSTHGASPSTATGEEPRECAAEDPEATFAARVEPCVDFRCNDTDPDYWFPPSDEPESAEVTRTLSCTVEASEVFGDDGRRWLLSDCSGAGSPPSGRVLFELQAPSLPALDVGDELDVFVHRKHGGWVYEETRAWTFRSPGGDLLAMISARGDLPPASMTAPLAISGAPQPCLERAAMGVRGPMEIEVSYGDDVAVIPSGNSEEVGPHLVVLAYSDYGADMLGLYGGWSIFRLLVVASAV